MRLWAVVFSVAAVTLSVVVTSSGAAWAGDADVGEKLFARCKACHMVTAPDGTPLVKGGKVGPNLFGVIGRAAASVEGFVYGDGILGAKAAGLVWTEDLLAEYVRDPTKFIDSHGGEGPSKMIFRLPKGGEDIAAYLATLK